MIKTVEDLKKVVSADGREWGKRGSWINRFKALRAMQDRAQKLYDLNYEIKVHSAYRKIKLPTARQMVDTCIAHLPLSNPVIEVIPFKTTTPYEKRAISQQDFYRALLLHSMSQTDPAILYAAKDFPLRGEAFLKILYDVGLLEGLPKPKDGEGDADYKERKLAYLIERMPIKMIAPDPMNCFPSSEHIDSRPFEMIEIYPAFVGDLKRVFPDWKTTKTDIQIAAVIEYWNDEKRCFLGDGNPMTDGMEDNPYKVTPYVHAYSGYGARTSGNEPEKKAVSILFEAEGILKQQSRWNSYLDKALEWSAMPIFNAEGEKEDYAEEGGAGLKPEPGMVVYGGEGKKVTVEWAAANMPKGIYEAIGMNDAMLRRVQPAVLRGEAPRGVEAGYPMALMIGEGRLQFGVVLENLKTLTGRALELVRYIIRDVVDDELGMWSESKCVTLNKEDCEGAYRIKVDFDATTQEARADRALVGQKLRQGGSISLYTELKDFQNNKNPNEEIDRITVEGLMKHPAMQRYIATKALLKKGEKEQAMLLHQAMSEGEEGALRKGESTGIPPGGKRESELPEDVLSQAIGRRGKATRGQQTEE